MNDRNAHLVFFTAAALAVCLGGCSFAETVDPVATPTTATPEPTSPPEDAGPPPVDPGPPRRTVTLRNPLGDGPANNLLLDGDFELSSSYGSGQYGWRMFDSGGSQEVPLALQTGGLCRSGLLCLRLAKGQVLFGRGTAAAGEKGHVMGLYARLPEGVPCSKIGVIAVECDTLAVKKKAAPDSDLSDGWCHYKGALEPSKSSICMYIQNTLGATQEAIIDAALLGPSDGTVPLDFVKEEPVDAETLAAMAKVRDYLRRTTPFGKRPVTGPQSLPGRGLQ